MHASARASPPITVPLVGEWLSLGRAPGSGHSGNSLIRRHLVTKSTSKPTLVSPNSWSQIANRIDLFLNVQPAPRFSTVTLNDSEQFTRRTFMALEGVLRLAPFSR